MFFKKIFISKIDSGSSLELFFISAVSTILITRFYLAINNYPQIGGGGLHIAHMLWGGLLMLASIIFLLSFSSKSINSLSSILSGIGFGLFIDELGKFITSDNNYFFEPTIALIYLIFVLLFLVFKLMRRQRNTASSLENIEKALEYMKYAVLNLSSSDKQNAIELLKKVESSSFSKNLLSAAVDIKVEEKQNILINFVDNFKKFYRGVSRNKWFLRSVVIFFVIFSLVNLYKSASVLTLFLKLNEFSLSLTDWGQFLSSAFAAIIVIIGIIRFKFSKIGGYKMFKLSLLVSILLTQFFDFYGNQIEASYVLVFNIIVYLIIGSIIEEENNRPAPVV